MLTHGGSDGDMQHSNAATSIICMLHGIWHNQPSVPAQPTSVDLSSSLRCMTSSISVRDMMMGRSALFNTTRNGLPCSKENIDYVVTSRLPSCLAPVNTATHLLPESRHSRKTAIESSIHTVRSTGVHRCLDYMCVSMHTCAHLECLVLQAAVQLHCCRCNTCVISEADNKHHHATVVEVLWPQREHLASNFPESTNVHGKRNECS